MTKKDNLCNSKYYECFAAKTLSSFVFQNKYLIMLSDRPDLRINDDEFGIEVTRGITEESAKTESFCNMYFDRKNSKSEIDKQAVKMKIGVSVFEIPNSKSRALMPKGTVDLNELKKIIAGRVDTKINNITGYDNVYKNNCIYVFCFWSYSLEEVLEIIELIHSIDKIDVLYFDCNSKLFIYDTKRNAIDTICQMDREKIAQESIEYAVSQSNVHKI